jgi:hypothetical protein
MIDELTLSAPKALEVEEAEEEAECGSFSEGIGMQADAGLPISRGEDSGEVVGGESSDLADQEGSEEQSVAESICCTSTGLLKEFNAL